jgi:hypothetical protein
VTRGTDLGGSRRKGLTGAGGSTLAHIKRQGATARGSRSSRRQCRAWGVDGVFREGSERWL